MGAHARKRHESTVRDVVGSRVDVHAVPGRCLCDLSIRECVSELDVHIVGVL